MKGLKRNTKIYLASFGVRENILKSLGLGVRCTDHALVTAEFFTEAGNDAHDATGLSSFQCGNLISKRFVVVAAPGRKLIKVAAALPLRQMRQSSRSLLSDITMR